MSEAAGETGRASFDPSGSHFLNPATLPFLNNYSVAGSFQFVKPELDSPGANSGFVINDNSGDVMMAAALGYVYKRQSYTDRIILDQDFSVSFSGRILPRVAVGVLGHRLVRQNTNGPSWAKHNVTVGVLLIPATILNIGLVAYDILNDDDLDMIPTIALGSELNVMNIFKVRADVTRQEKRNPNKAVTFGSGIEFDLGEGFGLRTGGIWDMYSQTFWTVGVNWQGPRLSAAYAYKNNINVAKDIVHNFSLWVNF